MAFLGPLVLAHKSHPSHNGTLLLLLPDGAADNDAASCTIAQQLSKSHVAAATLVAGLSRRPLMGVAVRVKIDGHL